MKLEQPSTQRGLIWTGAGILSTILLLLGHKEEAAYIMTIAGTVAGGLGVAIDDPTKTIVINKSPTGK